MVGETQSWLGYEKVVVVGKVYAAILLRVSNVSWKGKANYTAADGMAVYQSAFYMRCRGSPEKINIR